MIPSGPSSLATLRAVTPTGPSPRAALQLTPPGVLEVTLDQLSRRRALLQQLDRQVPALETASGFGRHQSMAFDLLMSPNSVARWRWSVSRWPCASAYGLTLFGQATLTARRLIEAGVQLATVFWDEYREANSAWDTHIHQYPRLKDALLPGFDLAYSALLTDLEARNLLDETLVVCISEHGRTPKLNNAPGGGREHWSQAYCGLFAGGGIRGGTVLGASDATAAFPKDQPVSPKDVLCTIYHLLGIDPHTLIPDREGRPVPLVPEGRVLRGLLA